MADSYSINLSHDEVLNLADRLTAEITHYERLCLAGQEQRIAAGSMEPWVDHKISLLGLRARILAALCEPALLPDLTTKPRFFRVKEDSSA